MLTTILAVIFILIGLLSSLVVVAMFLAGGANSSPAGIRQIKWMIASVVFVQALSLVSSIALLISERGWLAFAAGIFPSVYAIVLVVVLVKLEW
jgi:hypothetical protein